jgi:hypothetical protein
MVEQEIARSLAACRSPGSAAGARTAKLNFRLQDVADRDGAARFPVPGFRQLQASTYNRSTL